MFRFSKEDGRDIMEEARSIVNIKKFYIVLFFGFMFLPSLAMAFDPYQDLTPVRSFERNYNCEAEPEVIRESCQVTAEGVWCQVCRTCTPRHPQDPLGPLFDCWWQLTVPIQSPDW